MEAASGGFFDDAGVGEGGGGDGGGERDAGFGGVCDPEDFAAARGDAEFGRGEGRGGLEVERGERELVGAEGSVADGRGGGRGARGQSGVLRLQTDADDVEGGHCRAWLLALHVYIGNDSTGTHLANSSTNSPSRPPASSGWR